MAPVRCAQDAFCTLTINSPRFFAVTELTVFMASYRRRLLTR